MPIQLFAKDGDLYYPKEVATKWWASVGMDQSGDMIMVHRYPEGDADTISWPNPNRKVLAACLFDDRECGIIGDEEVLLPDGTSAWGIN